MHSCGNNQLLKTQEEFAKHLGESGNSQDETCKMNRK